MSLLSGKFLSVFIFYFLADYARSLSDLSTCETLLNAYLDEIPLSTNGTASNHTLLYFLHIPRTAGKTFFSCYLKPAFPPSRRCAKSYDTLRLQFSMPNCGLLSSHDDYSAVTYFPSDAAVLTQIRDPVDRFLSAYEFATEVAARGLKRSRIYRPDPNMISTQNVWPWSVLVPWFEDQLREKALAAEQAGIPDNGWRRYTTDEGEAYFYNAAQNLTVWELPEGAVELVDLDPYDNPLVVPLAQFVESDVAAELLHDGETLQVLGLTNYSHWAKATALRTCIKEYPSVAERLQQVALDRADKFVHMGVFDKLEESIRSSAASLGLDLEGSTWKSPKQTDISYGGDDTLEDVPGGHLPPRERRKLESGLQSVRKRLKELRSKLASLRKQPGEEQGSEARMAATLDQLEKDEQQLMDQLGIVPLSKAKGQARQLAPDDTFLQHKKVWQNYRECVGRSRAKNKGQRANSLRNLVMPDTRKVEFSREARKAIPAAVIERIRALNRMDLELYSLAQSKLAAQLAAHHESSALQRLPEVPTEHKRPDPPKRTGKQGKDEL